MKDTADFPAAEVMPPLPRNYNGVNWTGATTLYMKEVKRFWKVGMQTLAAPVLSSLLYLLIFVVAMKGLRPSVHGVPYSVFIGPGLIMMAILNSAFANSSSSLMQAKMQGLTQDFITPPLSPTEQVCAFALGAATRGILVGLVTAAAVLVFVRYNVAHWWAVAYFGMGAALMMGMIGMVAGLWAEKFDHMAAVTTFIVMPLSMLSGTFYLVDRLPEPFRTASHFNPMFYLIDGFRYGFVGRAEGSLVAGAVSSGVLAIGLVWAVHRMFETGWRLKS